MNQNTKTEFKTHIERNIQNIKILTCPDKDLINLFKENKRIIFCTMGKSAFACRKVVYTARSYGLDWHDLDVCHAFHGDAGIIKENDLLVFVSKSGETKETIEVAKYFSKWQNVSITSNNNSLLSRICKNNIHIPVIEEGSPFGYAPMISTTMYMIVLHGLLCESIRSQNVKIEDYARNHPSGKIGKDLKNAGL
jgi:arabinose-5-phosphate isomerase